MAEDYLQVRGIDPLLFRDGRPFGSDPGSLDARTQPLPPPGTLAGFVRTTLGNALGWNWAEKWREALEVAVYGPILCRNDQPVFAAPADAQVFESDVETLYTAVPLAPYYPPVDAGCDLPPGLQPLMLQSDNNGKPSHDCRYWPADTMWQWLAGARELALQGPPIRGPQTETRVHVAIDAETGRSKDGALFTTNSLCMDELYDKSDTKCAAEWSFAARAGVPFAQASVGTFGGERRLAAIGPARAGAWPDCPQELKRAIEGATHMRLILATPAVFDGGWRPGWIDAASLEGSPPGLPEVRLRLVSAAVPPRGAVSGWDMQRRGPKAVKWLAPAGSTYFFEILAGSGSDLLPGWLCPVSDSEQDRRDGYGLALWGRSGGSK